MADSVDLYEILQVHPSAHPEVIGAAYRRLALLYHPDRNPAPEASKMMVRINNAYEILSDPAKRSAYDYQRRSRQSSNPNGQGSNANTQTGYSDSEGARHDSGPSRAQSDRQEARRSSTDTAERQAQSKWNPRVTIGGVLALAVAGIWVLRLLSPWASDDSELGNPATLIPPTIFEPIVAATRQMPTKPRPEGTPSLGFPSRSTGLYYDIKETSLHRLG